MLARIAPDENLHMVFYRNLLGAAFELAPDQTMQAVRDVVVDVPDAGPHDPGLRPPAVQIAMAGIYDLRIHHDEVLAPVLRTWKVWDIEGLDAEGEQAREELEQATSATK